MKRVMLFLNVVALVLFSVVIACAESEQGIAATLQGKSTKIEYTVKKKDTIWKIAEKHGYNWKYVQELNKKKYPRPERIRSGDVIVLNNVRKIASGETYAAIAKKYDLTARSLRQANEMKKLLIGDGIIIPPVYPRQNIAARKTEKRSYITGSLVQSRYSSNEKKKRPEIKPRPQTKIVQARLTAINGAPAPQPAPIRPKTSATIGTQPTQPPNETVNGYIQKKTEIAVLMDSNISLFEFNTHAPGTDDYRAALNELFAAGEIGAGTIKAVAQMITRGQKQGMFRIQKGSEFFVYDAKMQTHQRMVAGLDDNTYPTFLLSKYQITSGDKTFVIGVKDGLVVRIDPAKLAVIDGVETLKKNI